MNQAQENADIVRKLVGCAGRDATREGERRVCGGARPAAARTPGPGLRAVLLGSVVCLLSCATARAETLAVGPGGKYATLAAAAGAAKAGDVIQMAAGDYTNDWCRIAAAGLTVRGVGKGRARLVSRGMIANRKAILVAAGDGLTVENVEFIGARVRDCNGAGIRAEGRGLTVRNCRFYDCEDGILGGAGEILVEGCEFDRCGHCAGAVATHSIYIAEACTRLTFRNNYSHHTLGGHLLKTRARESWILYNRLTDEDGRGSAVADFPNGGLVVLVGNALHKGPKGDNNRMIAVGMEGLKHDRNEVYAVNNSMWWNNRRPDEMSFVHAVNRVSPRQGGAPEAPARKEYGRIAIFNNVCAGPLRLTNAEKFEAGGNLVIRSVEEAGYADPAVCDFRLKPESPAVDGAVDPGRAGDFPLRPQWQYEHPCGVRRRPDDGRLDIGAFELAHDRPGASK